MIKIRSWRKIFQLQRGDYFHPWVVLGFDNYGEWTILHTFSYKSQAKRWIVEQKELLHEEFKDWCDGRVIISTDGTKLNFSEITLFHLWQMNRLKGE